MLNQQTTDQLRALKLTGMLEAWEQQREQPQTHDLSFDERLALLVEREVLHRENRRLARLLKAEVLADHALGQLAGPGDLLVAEIGLVLEAQYFDDFLHWNPRCRHSPSPSNKRRQLCRIK